MKVKKNRERKERIIIHKIFAKTKQHKVTSAARVLGKFSMTEINHKEEKIKEVLSPKIIVVLS